MIIPSRLSDLLQKSNQLNGVVLQTISIVRPWFEDNKLVFFPEYTDHGPKHIQDVFETCESLISESAWPLLRSEDVATLILGIILHDCAMHLSEDGFISLISDASRPVNDSFGDKPWPQLWEEYMAEARRFDERKLKALLGDVEPVQLRSVDPLGMSKRDHLLIGEFLRRHHARLAHEIALHGVPGPGNNRLALADIPRDVKDLGGLVARSHGLDLRVCVDYLNSQSKWGARRSRGVHVTYLMVLVRIGDYLQIHGSRAPQEVLRVRSLKSPVSRGEWNVHEAVKDIHQETDDPEALWVEGEPKDVQTYLKLKYLLSDIQREMDDCWAVLGEVYGPKEELRGFGITLRRIRSNLQDSPFLRSVSYVPCQAALTTAGVDLLKLLITPLYGDRPEVGIRELLQNAIDACRELKDYLSKNPHLRVDLQEQSADVVIEVYEEEDGTKWIKISDRGIGMSVDTILNYFLKAGASFRNSFAWRKQHEDDQGASQVLRSGRFGIGVLAGFLLGREIQVKTRHVSAQASDGLSFTCRLEDEHIQLDRVTRSVGTTVSIQLSDTVYLQLSRDQDDEESDDDNKDAEIGVLNWDWYCLDEPSVHRVTPTGRLEQLFVLPAVNSTLPPKWRRIKHPDYMDLHWSYSDGRELTCNGIAVEELNERDDIIDLSTENYKKAFSENRLVCPNLSIFDPDGNLPLNLQRTSLSVGKLPFENELIDDVCFDVLAYLLLHTPETPPSPHIDLSEQLDWSLTWFNETVRVRTRLRHPGLSDAFWYYYSVDGLALLHPWNVEQSHTSTVWTASSAELFNLLKGKSFQPHLDGVTEEVVDRLITIPSFGWLGRLNFRLIYNDALARSFVRRPGIARRQLEKHIGQIEWAKGDWQSAVRGDCPPLEGNLEKVARKLEREGPQFLLMIYPNQDEQHSRSRLSEIWREVIQLPYIPYNIEERRTKLADAYKQLAPYIEAWNATQRESSQS